MNQTFTLSALPTALKISLLGFFSLIVGPLSEVMAQLPPTMIIYSVEPMNECRSLLGLANVGHGLVLAAGGQSGSGVTATADLYTFAEGSLGSWESVAPMSVSRTNFQLVSLPEGRALAVGGWDGDFENHSTTEIFTASNQEWIAGPSLSVGRSNLASTQLLDGKILFSGGFNGFADVAACDIYDPTTNTMTAVADMNFARSSHATILMEDGKVLVAGGFNPEYGFQMVECEIYDPATNVWTEIAPLNSGRDNFSGIRLLNESGQAVVIGGRYFDADLNHFVGQSSGEHYDTATQEWSLFSLPSPQSYHLLFYSFDNAFVAAGVDHSGIGITTTYSGALINSGSNQWVDIDEASIGLVDDISPRYQAAYAPVYPNSDWIIMIAGGDPECIGTAEIWNWSSSVSETADPSMSFFPNPVVDFGFIGGLTGRVEWSIQSLSGQLIHSGEGSKVDVRGLASGAYLLNVKNNEGTFSKRILVH